MQANETVLELWIEALCAELGELSGALITAASAPHEGSGSSAFETTLLAQGPIQGELSVTVEGGALVQVTQLSAGEPLDPEVPCDGERIESWRRLVDSTAQRLAARLTAEFTGAGSGQCVFLLVDTHPVENTDLLSGEPGSRIQRWLLQAGQSQLAILARAKIESPEELLPVAKPSSEAEKFAAPSESYAPVEDQPNPQRSSDKSPDKQAMPPASEPVLPTSATASRGTPTRDFDDQMDAQIQPRRLDLLLDIELEATLRFGAIEMPLREVLELGPGDVLSLDRHVQEPVELVVGDRIVARGEVVLIGGNFGLHVTEVAEPRRRLETIRCLF